ncbi:nitrite reductase [Desulforudis sp. 1088]|uniref:nitrite reductase n=1 Tax=unclassified Candidatus Desulforudis TaxID=2635950 RepID=UPI003479D217
MGEAVFVQKNGLMAVVAVGRCGLMTVDEFKGVAANLEKWEAAAVKLSSRQTLVILVPEGKAALVKEDLINLGLKVNTFGEAIRNVKACCGDAGLCKWTHAEALKLGMAIEEKFWGRATPDDFKIALSGCGRGCTDPLCADFGAMGTRPGAFDVFIGGRGSTQRPIHGQRIAEAVSAEGVIEVLEWVLARYAALAKSKERLWTTIKRVGIEEFTPPPEMLERYQVKQGKH